MDSVKLQIAKDHLAVAAMVQTTQFIEPREVQALQGELSTAVGHPVRLEIQQLQVATKEPDRPVEGTDYLGGGLLPKAESQGRTAFTTATIATAQDRVQTSLTSLLTPAGVKDLTVHSLGLQPDDALQLEIAATQKESVGQAAWQVAAESVSRELGVPLRIRADVTFTDRSCELSYKPGAIRLTGRQTAELRKLIQNSSGPDKRYISAYLPTENPELAKRRITFLGRYFREADLSSEPDPKLPADLIIIRGQMHLEVSGGQTQSH